MNSDLPRISSCRQRWRCEQIGEKLTGMRMSRATSFIYGIPEIPPWPWCLGGALQGEGSSNWGLCRGTGGRGEGEWYLQDLILMLQEFTWIWNGLNWKFSMAKEGQMDAVGLAIFVPFNALVFLRSLAIAAKYRKKIGSGRIFFYA